MQPYAERRHAPFIPTSTLCYMLNNFSVRHDIIFQSVLKISFDSGSWSLAACAMLVGLQR